MNATKHTLPTCVCQDLDALIFDQPLQSNASRLQSTPHGTDDYQLDLVRNLTVLEALLHLFALLLAELRQWRIMYGPVACGVVQSLRMSNE